MTKQDSCKFKNGVGAQMKIRRLILLNSCGAKVASGIMACAVLVAAFGSANSEETLRNRILGKWYYNLPTVALNTLGEGMDAFYKVCGQEENYENGTSIGYEKILISVALPDASDKIPIEWSKGAKFILVLNSMGSAKYSIENNGRVVNWSPNVLSIDEWYAWENGGRREIETFSPTIKDLFKIIATGIEAEFHKFYSMPYSETYTVISISENRLVESYANNEGKMVEVVSTRSENDYHSCVSATP